MTSTNERIFQNALSLPEDMRLSLIEELLKSLNLPTGEEIDRMWAVKLESKENIIPLERDKTYRLPPPYNSYGAAEILMRALKGSENNDQEDHDIDNR